MLYNYSYFDVTLGYKVKYEGLTLDQLRQRLVWDEFENFTDVTIESLQ